MTATTTNLAPGDLRALLASWQRSLRARRLSPKTISSYLDSAHQLADFLVATGMPTDVAAIRREHVETFLVHLEDTGRGPETVATRYRCLAQVFKWLLEEGEIDRSPMERMHPPKLPEKLTPVLTDEQITAMLALCKGKSFEQLRNRALLLVFIDTGLRRAEVAHLAVDDVKLDAGLLIVRSGNGDRERLAPVGAATSEALDRYARARNRHRARASSAFWLGIRGPMTDDGVAKMLGKLARAAGVEHFHCHMLRHGWAHSMLAAGATEGAVMRLGGWKTRSMLDRYGNAVADQRAIETHRALSPADRVTRR